MQNLIEDIRVYSRVNTRGRLLEPVDSAAVLKEILEQLAGRIAETRARRFCSRRASRRWRMWSRRCPRTGRIGPDWGSTRRWPRSSAGAEPYMTLPLPTGA
jgi:hypothetical protein